MRAAVLGRPIAHSLSPLLHRAAYAALGLTDWTYDALDVGAEELPVLIAGLGQEWRGFSVTMPCKQAAVEVADVVEPLPRMLDAANTLVRTDGGLAGREHRRRRHRHGPAGGRRRERARVRRSWAPVARRQRPRWRWPRSAPSTSRSSSGSRRGPPTSCGCSTGSSVATTVSDFAGSSVDAPLVVSTVPIGGAGGGRSCRGGATTPCSTSCTTPGRPRWRSGSAGAGGRVIGGSEVLFWQATARSS